MLWFSGICVEFNVLLLGERRLASEASKVDPQRIDNIGGHVPQRIHNFHSIFEYLEFDQIYNLVPLLSTSKTVGYIEFARWGR